MKYTIDDCTIIEIPKNHSDRGSLSVVESNNSIPFEIKRVYFTYDIPSGAERGGHAHKNLFQLIVAASGSFNVLVDDGVNSKELFLNNPSKGLIVTPGIWREINNFSAGGIVLVMASELYDDGDYYRNYSEFKGLK
ncbi:sugar 3,4-ketoisomerase [Saccharicrinis aurantiacus]|uniref:sugar 3,4-ketoisomerase n=1 Tax=Saccharicrinis aurantiacus TaxID=1849719 RepID=UPI002492BBC5|nr:FdtA/QdtA family cupin domain-containing protein [Saccharicrinis aurantiacus]